MKTREEIETMEKLIETLKLDVSLKQKYIDVLEERYKKYDKLKARYKMLYEFADKLCGIIEKQNKQIEDLVDVNKKLEEINKQACERLEIFCAVLK